jgi:epoxyqueuosine reductase QueG
MSKSLYRKTIGGTNAGWIGKKRIKRNATLGLRNKSENADKGVL